MKKKLLVTYGSYGSGHKSIAESIANYFIENSSDEYEVKILDITNYCNLLGRISVSLMNFNIKHRAEFLFDLCYELSDNKVGSFSEMRFVKKSFDNARMRKFFEEFKPDITISTHYFCSNLVAYYNKINYIDSKIVTVLTDYASHSFWRQNHEQFDAYVVANEMVKKEMTDKGVDRNMIHVLGMPYDTKKLLDLKSKKETIKKYNIDTSKKTYVFFGGGSAGSMSYYPYFKALAKMRYPINLIFICGKNKKLERKAKNFVLKNNLKRVQVLGFVKDVYSLLQVADFVISKPGGATVTECILMNVPLIAIPGYGGQEKYNGRFIVNKKFGLKTRGTIGLNRTVQKTLKRPYLEKSFKRNLEKNELNESTKKIYELCKKIMSY